MGVTGNAASKQLVENFLTTFRTAMAIAGEVHIFVATFAFSGREPKPHPEYIRRLLTALTRTLTAPRC